MEEWSHTQHAEARRVVEALRRVDRLHLRVERHGAMKDTARRIGPVGEYEGGAGVGGLGPDVGRELPPKLVESWVDEADARATPLLGERDQPGEQRCAEARPAIRKLVVVGAVGE